MTLNFNSAPPREHPGSCPRLEDDIGGICVEMCQGDADCDADEKCCSNGCGHTCQRAETIGM